MAKRGLSHSDHLRLGQILAGLQVALLQAEVDLENAYPRSGERAFPAKQLGAAGDALREARRALESAVFDEHPTVAATEDYFPYSEHEARVEVPPKPGSSSVRFGWQS
ncbi:hypothetical protein ACFY15_00565 [Streptomyces sp. NPDC001373]|uniref:hypothetical protein n=1 Tax=Streptomyces sp. NPDC001373 TaxID=3364565 RepID=UPI0036CC2AC0